MLIEPILLALLVGLLAKGKMSNLIAIEWRGVYLPMGAALIEGVASVLHERTMLNSGITLGTQVIVYGLLVAFFVMNRQIKGLNLVGLGVLLNLIVVFANGGYMPVDITMAESYRFIETMSQLKRGAIFGHTLMTEGTFFNILGDWIHIPPPYWFPKSVSPGDLTMDLGFVVTIVAGMRKEA